MRQRLGIAQALLNSPAVLIVDEPTAGLDPAERIRFRQLIVQLATNRTVVLSTHLLEDVSLTQASRVIVLNWGQIRFDGSISALKLSAEGSVWLTHLTHAEFETFQQQYAVTNITATEEGLTVKFLSHKPPDMPAEPTSPSLEDAYLRWVQMSS